MGEAISFRDLMEENEGRSQPTGSVRRLRELIVRVEGGDCRTVIQRWLRRE